MYIEDSDFDSDSSEDDLILPDPELPKLPTIQERVNEIWKEYTGEIPFFPEERLKWMDSLYRNLVKFIELGIDYDISDMKNIKKNITGLMLTRTPFITEKDKDEISERSVMSSDFRKGFTIITSIIEMMIRKKKNENNNSNEQRNFRKINELKDEFFILKNYSPEKYSLYELRLAICLYRSHLCESLYSKSLKLYFKSIVHRIRQIITYTPDPSSNETRRVFDYDLFTEKSRPRIGSGIENNDNNNNITNPNIIAQTTLSDYFFDFVEKFIYFNKRKFYFCEKGFYSKLRCKVSPSIVSKFLSLFKEKLASSAIKESLDSVFSKSFPPRLVLTSDIEHFLENNKEKKYVSAIKILYKYRVQHLMPHWEMITKATGFCEKYLGLIDHYFEYFNQDKKSYNPFIEEFSCALYLRVMEEKLSVDLERYIIREEDLFIPFSSNDFTKKKLPYIVKTFRGWNIWDFTEKKMINYRNFIECGIAFLFVIKDLTTRFGLSEKENYVEDYDLLRKASMNCKKFFEIEMNLK